MSKSRIHILGQAGLQVVRQRVDADPERLSFKDAEDIWSEQVSQHADRVAGPLWTSLSRLAADSAAEELDPELAFARRTASFLQSLYGQSGVRASTLDLLSLNPYPPTWIRDEVAAESLKIVGASAPAIGGMRDGRALLASEGLPRALRSVERRTGLEGLVQSTARTLGQVARDAGVKPSNFKDERLVVAPSASRGESAARSTYVNVGLDDPASPGAGSSLTRIGSGQSVLLWVELGPKNRAAVTGESAPVEPTALEEGQELDVVVFPDEDLAVEPQLGRVKIVNGSAFPVITPIDQSPPEYLLDTRLYCSFTLPRESGRARLRVAVYLRGVLVHVEQVTIPVGLDEAPSVRTTHRLLTEYRASDGFKSLTPPSLSIYANDGEGTHDFSFFIPGEDGAAGGIPNQLSISAHALSAAIALARTTLGDISWNPPGSYKPGYRPKFPIKDGAPPSVEKLQGSLIQLAIAGWNIWRHFADRLGESFDFRRSLQGIMSKPGAVQLSLKDEISHVLPIQMIYDKTLEDAIPERIEVCSATKAWLETPVGEPPCIRGTCPQQDSSQHVCVAGFWGIRHNVAISVPSFEGDLRTTLSSTAPPVGSLATTTDKRIEPHWTKHETDLKGILQVPSKTAHSAGDAIKSWKTDEPALIYFLAHAEADKHGSPRIILDEHGSDGAINGSTLYARQVELSSSRPLVFMNTCESAALSPDQLVGLVDSIFQSGAHGAIGTEITVFVDLAVVFAKRAIESFASEGQTMAEALRQARIECLRRGNPTGFAYAGFGLHDLRLAPTQETAADIP